MCRRNQLCGAALVAFGVGMLVGYWLESGFFCFVAGVAVVALGLWCASKK